MNNNLIKNTFYIMVGNIGTKLLMLIMVPLYSNWLTPEEYGSYDLVNSMACFFVPLVTLQLEQAVFRFVFEQKEKKEKIFTIAFFYSILITVLVVIVSIPFFYNNKDYYWVILFVVTQSIFNLIKEYIRGETKMVRYSFANIFSIVIILVLNVVFVYCLHLGIVGIYLSYIIAYGFSAIFWIMVESPFYIEFNVGSEVAKKMFLFSIPLIPNTIAFWIVNLSDRFMIKIWLGEYYNGQYAIACKVPSLITTIYSAFILAWQTEAIELIKKNNYKKISKILETVTDILFSGMFVISSSMPLIYKYCINSNYYSSLYLVPVLLLGTVWLSLAQFINGILIANYNTKDIGVTTSLVAIINVLINLFFMREYGLVVAVISTAVAYLILMILRMRLIKRFINYKLVIRIVAYSILEVLFLAYFRLNNMRFVLFSMIICSLFFAIVNKNIMIKILKKGVR